ncbi:MAG: hypothetical protein CMI26_10695 [Opitutae bacterium]|nr:hypothetical protein [Opitutae bacterium]|tara:strand:+ start:1940 stop:4339 length:2400 start_codon:yes stop_codon:yes gene_type:complete
MLSSSSSSSPKEGVSLSLDGHIEPKQLDPSSTGTTLAEVVACVERCPTLYDALAEISKSSNVPLLFTQKEACQDGKGGRIIFSRVSNVSRARRRAELKREFYRTPSSRNFFKHGEDERGRKGGGGGEGRGWNRQEGGKGKGGSGGAFAWKGGGGRRGVESDGGKGNKKGYHYHQNQRQSQPALPKPPLGGGCGKGLEHRGTAERSPQAYYENAAREEDQGTVLRSGTVVAAGPVGFVTAMTTQPLLHGVIDDCSVCFSNEPGCPCCGLVPTNLAASVLGARKLGSSMKCLQNAVKEFGYVFSEHEALYRKSLNDGGVAPDAWSGDCTEQCAKRAFDYITVKEGCEALADALDAITARFGEGKVEEALDSVGQHRFKDAIDATVVITSEKMPPPGDSLLAQIGPLAEVTMCHDGKHMELRLLQDTTLHLLNSDDEMVTTTHRAGEAIEFPTDACTAGTRLASLEEVHGGQLADGSTHNLRTKPTAIEGDLVYCSFHTREYNVDHGKLHAKRIAKDVEDRAAARAAGLPEPPPRPDPAMLVADLVVPHTVAKYREWQDRALESYQKLELLDVVSAPLSPMVLKARDAIRREVAEKHGFGGGGDALGPLCGVVGGQGLGAVTLRSAAAAMEMCPDKRRAWHEAAMEMYERLEADQSQTLHVMDRWIEDRRAACPENEHKTENELLAEIHQLVAKRYIHNSGKYSDLDRYVEPLKLRMGFTDGIGQSGRNKERDGDLNLAYQRREWRNLGVRGADLHESAPVAAHRYVASKFERIAEATNGTAAVAEVAMAASGGEEYAEEEV